MRRSSVFLAATTALLLVGTSVASAAAEGEAKALDELRNTVVNLLQGLVDRGVLSREQAEKIVRDAQAKAVADGDAAAAQEAAESNAVRVPYVPEIVRDEIRRQVSQDLEQQVTRNVVENAESAGWGVPGALPDWVRRMRWYGDVRVRGQGDLFASDNIANVYLDYQAINDAGGISKAGSDAFMNVTEDRARMRARLRFGFETTLGYGWSVGTRLASGSLRDPISTNQTLGNTGARYQLGIDLAYIDWQGTSHSGRQNWNVSGGRIASPWFSASDLVFDQDLVYDGAAGRYRIALSQRDYSGSSLFASAGAFPLQEVELGRDKWLLGGQLGLDLKFENGARLRTAAAYYQYQNVTGRRNALQSELLDYTAPQSLRQGNSLFDIRNDNDPTTERFALAADYHLVNASAVLDLRVGAAHRLSIAADYVQNIGFSEAEVLARSGRSIEKRNRGYLAEVGFGSAVSGQAHAWRINVGYRYLERDAVLDAFAESDFRLGGTDLKGYTIGLDYYLSQGVQSRLRYLSGNEIDGPPLGIDVIQLDLTASF